MPARPKQPYHHGNLRRSMLEAALRLITEQGVAALTLREVARRVGVSHAAPYRHFRDREALVAAVAEEGFRGMLAALQAALAKASRSRADPLGALGVAYVEYALAHPAELRVMFAVELADRTRHPSLAAISSVMHGVLVQRIVEAQAEGKVVPGDARKLAFAAWSMVHGCAMLLLDGQMPDADPRELARAVTHYLEQGFAVLKGRR